VEKKNTDPDRLATANSPNFSSGGGSAFALSSATRYKSASDLAADEAKITSPNAIPCFKTFIESEISTSGLLPGGTAKVKTLVFTLHPYPTATNVYATAHAVIAVSVSGITANAPIDLAFVTGKNTEALVEFGGLGLNKTLESDVFKAIARRAAA